MNEGLIGLIGFIAINILLTAAFSFYRKKNERLDLYAVMISAAVATVIFHIILVIVDIKSLMWLLISVPTAFMYGLCASGLTNIFVQWYIMRKHNKG